MYILYVPFKYLVWMLNRTCLTFKLHLNALSSASTDLFRVLTAFLHCMTTFVSEDIVYATQLPALIDNGKAFGHRASVIE